MHPRNKTSCGVSNLKSNKSKRIFKKKKNINELYEHYIVKTISHTYIHDDLTEIQQPSLSQPILCDEYISAQLPTSTKELAEFTLFIQRVNDSGDLFIRCISDGTDQPGLMPLDTQNIH